MKPTIPKSPIFPAVVASEMERLASQKHPQLIPHAQARLFQFRRHYSVMHEREHDRIIDTVSRNNQRFSKRLVATGSVVAGSAAVMELIGAEASNSNGPLVIAAGIGMAAVGVAWRRVQPSADALPPSEHVEAIDGYIARLYQDDAVTGDNE